jgi:uncharacterized protein with NRDE domain
METAKNLELSRDSLRLIAGERIQLGLCRAFLYEILSHLDSTDPLHARCTRLLECSATSNLHEKLQIPDAESGVDWDRFLTPLEIESIKLGP